MNDSELKVYNYCNKNYIEKTIVYDGIKSCSHYLIDHPFGFNTIEEAKSFFIHNFNKLSLKGDIIFWRVRPNLCIMKDFDTLNVKYKIKARFSIGVDNNG